MPLHCDSNDIDTTVTTLIPKGFTSATRRHFMNRTTAFLMVLLVATLSLSGCLRNGKGGEGETGPVYEPGPYGVLTYEDIVYAFWSRPHGYKFGSRARFVETRRVLSRHEFNRPTGADVHPRWWFQGGH